VSTANLPLAAATALASLVFSFAVPALPFRDRDPVVQLLSVAPLPWREADGGSDDHGDDARPRYFYADRGAEGFWMFET
jgi:hypothetical protein